MSEDIQENPAEIVPAPEDLPEIPTDETATTDETIETTDEILLKILETLSPEEETEETVSGSDDVPVDSSPGSANDNPLYVTYVNETEYLTKDELREVLTEFNDTDSITDTSLNDYSLTDSLLLVLVLLVALRILKDSVMEVWSKWKS